MSGVVDIKAKQDSDKNEISKIVDASQDDICSAEIRSSEDSSPIRSKKILEIKGTLPRNILKVDRNIWSQDYLVQIQKQLQFSNIDECDFYTINGSIETRNK